MARFFNPQKYFIVLIDQRGSGKSTPSGEMHCNTTSHLISDFEKVRKYLKIDKWMIYGGSWGSTLSLAYAIHHPERTTELIIRGVYFCTDQENHWVSEPNGAQRFNPEAWNYYKNALPKGHIPKKTLFVDEYAKCFKTATKSDKDKCLLAWGVWEESISTLNPIPLANLIKDVKKSKYQQMSVIENAYFKNNCFLPKDFFTNEKNLNKLKYIPITIVQGLYDLVTPFVTAYSLHKSLPHSKFFPTIAGHSAMELENIKYLVKATDLATNN
jgi:proline iminopeptidase